MTPESRQKERHNIQ